MDNPRKIIHFDLDAFFCAVEEFLDPSLNGLPFAVGGRPDKRGVVASCSYAARRFGVRSAMPMAKAVRLCPDLLIRGRNGKEYSKKSKMVMGILRTFSPLVEQLSIDEAFLDLSSNEKPIYQIAHEIHNTISTKTGLPSSLGAASNKLVAKIATDVGKSSVHTNTYPNTIQVVPPGEEANFLAPLPTQALWGIGPKTSARLSNIGIITIGDIANTPKEELAKKFGQLGLEIADRARGKDSRKVVTNKRIAKSISHEVTFPKDVKDKEKLLNVLKKHSNSIEGSLKRSNLLGSTIKIKIRWPDFETITRQYTLPDPTDDSETIYQSAVNLFEDNWSSGKLVRLLGLGITGFNKTRRQLSLWDIPDQRIINQLEETLEDLRKKYGDKSILTGKEFKQ